MIEFINTHIKYTQYIQYKTTARNKINIFSAAPCRLTKHKLVCKPEAEIHSAVNAATSSIRLAGVQLVASSTFYTRPRQMEYSTVGGRDAASDATRRRETL